MRCRACDCELNDYEATRKSVTTNEYLDLCDDCFDTVADVFESVEERLDLKPTDTVEGEDYGDN